MRYLRTYNENLNAIYQDEVKSNMIDLIDLDFVPTNAHSSGSFPCEFTYTATNLIINAELIDAFKKVIRRLKGIGYTIAYYKLQNEMLNRANVKEEGFLEDAIKKLEAATVLFEDNINIREFNVTVFSESRKLEHKLINDLINITEDEGTSYSSMEKKNLDHFDNEQLDPTGLVRKMESMLIAKGWTSESIAEVASKIDYELYYNGQMDLFLYHFNKTSELGGFMFTDNNHEFSIKIGYGYHKTKYGSIRHKQNFANDKETLLNRLFDVCMIKAVLNNDCDIEDVSDLAEELGGVSIPNYDILKFLKNDKKFPISKTTTGSGYKLSFSVGKLYNMPFIPHGRIGLNEFKVGLKDAFEKYLATQTEGMVIGRVVADKATLTFNLFL